MKNRKNRAKPAKKVSLSQQLKRLIISTLAPMILLILVTLGIFLVSDLQYKKVSGNITMASGFSQDFKNEIDLKMYYFATESEYATGLPIDNVEAALTLARKLKQRTDNKDSEKAITSVISLCDNLEEKIFQISKVDSYDERMEQLDSNVYILTELIQKYMYTYMYYEAGALASIQARQDRTLAVEGVLVILLTIILIAFAIINSVRITRSITYPIDELYTRVQKIGDGELAPEEPVPAEDPKLMALSESFEEMIGRLAQQKKENRIEQQKIREMELMLLQAQINPHFLYNTLDTIIWLIEMDRNEQAVEMVTSLSTFFRTSLSRGRDVITLNEEQLHVKSYLEIQQVRYKDILTYDVDVDESIGNAALPKLTLQPIVENALYHGIKLKREVGHIGITAKKVIENTGKAENLIENGSENAAANGSENAAENAAGNREGPEYILIKVEDTGIGMNEETLQKVLGELDAEKSDGFGMSAVYKRLKLRFGDDFDFRIESEEGKGTRVTIRIPYETVSTLSEETSLSGE